MPILPAETQRKIQRREREFGGPDRMGEEGILHIVASGDERYFAKQWYTVSEKRLTNEPAEGTSPASPYWHKVKFYEGKLIQEAFPDIAVEMAAAYDPRLQKNAAGRMVTLTKAALFQVTETIREKCEEYSNAILQQLYQPTINEAERIVRASPDRSAIITGLHELAARIAELPVDRR